MGTSRSRPLCNSKQMSCLMSCTKLLTLMCCTTFQASMRVLDLQLDHLFCKTRFVINKILGDKASGRMLMQVNKARSPSSRTHLRPALPNSYSMFRSELHSLLCNAAATRIKQRFGCCLISKHNSRTVNIKHHVPALLEHLTSNACLSATTSSSQAVKSRTVADTAYRLLINAKPGVTLCTYVLTPVSPT